MSDEKRNNPSSPDSTPESEEPIELDPGEILLVPDDDDEEEELLIPLDEDDNEEIKADLPKQEPKAAPNIKTEQQTKATSPKADKKTVVDTEEAEVARQNSMTYPLLALLAIAAVALIQIWMAGKTGLGDAEAYYYSFSKNLSLSYYDHPPAIAYLISLGTLWMGDTVLGVRIVSIIISSLCALTLYLFTTNLFNSGRSGLLATLLFLVTPVIFVGGSSASPDVAMVLMWLFASWLLSRAVSKGDPIYLIATGIVVGLGLLCKYFMILFWPAAILYLLFARGYKLLFSIWFLLGIVFSLLFFAPVLIWNFQNDWVSFSYHLTARHASASFSTARLLHFAGGQALYLSPLIFIALLVSVFKSIFNIFRKNGNDAQLLFWLTIPVLALMYVIGSWTAEAEPHWALLGYVLLYPTLGNWLAGLTDKPATMAERIIMTGPFAIWFTPKRRNLLTGWLLVLPIILLGVLVLHLSTTTFTSLVNENLVTDPKYDISNELRGWDEVGIRINEEMAKLDEGSFLASYHYTMCGQLNFATKNRYPVKCLSRRTDAFDFFDNSTNIKGKQALFVTDNRYNDKPENRIACEHGITPVDKIKIIRDGVKIREFNLFRCNGYQRTLMDGEKPATMQTEDQKTDVPQTDKTNVLQAEPPKDNQETKQPEDTLKDEQPVEAEKPVSDEATPALKDEPEKEAEVNSQQQKTTETESEAETEEEKETAPDTKNNEPRIMEL